MESTDVSDAAQITAAPTITEQPNFGGPPQFFVHKNSVFDSATAFICLYFSSNTALFVGQIRAENKL